MYPRDCATIDVSVVHGWQDNSNKLVSCSLVDLKLCRRFIMTRAIYLTHIYPQPCCVTFLANKRIRVLDERMSVFRPDIYFRLKCLTHAQQVSIRVNDSNTIKPTFRVILLQTYGLSLNKNWIHINIIIYVKAISKRCNVCHCQLSLMMRNLIQVMYKHWLWAGFHLFLQILVAYFCVIDIINICWHLCSEIPI